jgi:thiamine transport system permease protein
VSLRRLALYGLPLGFLAVLFFYPLAAILNLSLRPDGLLNLDGFGTVLGSAYYRDVLWFTLWQAALSTALTVGLAIPCAYVFTRYRFPGRGLMLSLATLPFVLPTVVVAAAFRALIWPGGVVNDALMWILNTETAPLQLQRTLAAILIAHVFYNFAIALRMITGYWANQSTRIEEAGRVLGAHGWNLWWYVRLPVLRPVLLASAVLVFIFTFTSFGVVLILGGFEYATLEVEIFYQARDALNLPVAAALSLIQIGLMFLLMIVYTRLQRTMTTDLQSAGQVARRPRTVRERVTVGLTVSFIMLLLFAPLLALVWRSFDFGGGDLLDHYRNVVENRAIGRPPLQRDVSDLIGLPPLEVVMNSLSFALMTTGIALVLGVLTAYLVAGRGRSRPARWLDPLFMLPLATSAVTLGFGYIIAMDFDGVRALLNRALDPLGIPITASWDLRAAWVLIPLAHTLVALPFVVRSVLPALRSIAPSINEAAEVLGARPFRRWLLVELPLISRGIVVGATFAFTVSMGEFGASVFIARTETTTLPVAIESLLGQAGTSGEAYVLSSLLMAVCAVSFVTIERVRTAGIGEF